MSVLPFLHLIESLKKTPRTGWLNENVEHPESIADHMYRMAMAVFLCSDKTLDVSRMVKIAIVHDMAESICGDITPKDNMPKEQKRRIELDAMQTICNDILPASCKFASDEFMALFLEYENKTSAEARFVKDVDKFELALQTFEYEKAHRIPGDKKLDDFFASADQAVHPQVQGWCDEVRQERDAWWAQQSQNANGTV